MKKIFTASFLLIAFSACEKTTEDNLHCWKCTRDVYTDNNGQITRTTEENSVCGLSNEEIENYKRRNSSRTLLNVTYGDLTCVQKDSI